MLSLLRSEWYQVRKALSVKITLGIVLIASIIFGMKFIDPSYIEAFKTSDLRYLMYGGGSLCSMMQDGAMALLLASLFAGWLISGGFEQRVIQESIAYGRRRLTVYGAKMLMYLLVVTGLCLVYWLATSLPAFLKNGLGTQDICGNLCQVSYIIGMMLAAILAYMSLFSFCGVIAFWTRRVGLTMGICFVGILFGGNLLASIVSEGIREVINYTPLGLYNRVLKLDVQWTDIWLTAGISLIWLGIICTVGYLKFRKTELK